MHPLLDGVRVEDLFTQAQSQSLPPISTSPIEFDVHCSCIRNSVLLENEAFPPDSLVPISFVNSLRSLWQEEQERRRRRKISTPLCNTPLPSTQTSHRPPGKSENDFKIRLDNLFQKGIELNTLALSAGDNSTFELSQWTKQCIMRQNLYQDSFQEFSQRAENYNGEGTFSPPILVEMREPEEDEVEDEGDG